MDDSINLSNLVHDHGISITYSFPACAHYNPCFIYSKFALIRFLYLKMIFYVDWKDDLIL